MFKRITLSLLYAAMVFGAAIDNTATAATSAAAATAATGATADAAATGATTVAATGADAGAATAAQYTPKFSDAQVAAAQNAPVYKYCTNPQHVALTFDDGPKVETTPIVLDFLKQNQIPATFFINGNNVSDLETNPEAVALIKRAYQEGHTIGSHTYYHANLFDAIQKGTMEMNIDMMTDKIEQIIGVKPAYFRPPEGCGGYDPTPEDKDKNDKVQKYLGAAGYSVIMWGADTRDWENQENVAKDIETLTADMALNNGAQGYVVLMHDVHANSANLALPQVVEFLKGKGFTFVTLEECLGIPAYQNAQPQQSLVTNNLSANSTAAPVDTSDASSVQSKMLFSVIAMILSLFFLY